MCPLGSPKVCGGLRPFSLSSSRVSSQDAFRGGEGMGRAASPPGRGPLSVRPTGAEAPRRAGGGWLARGRAPAAF